MTKTGKLIALNVLLLAGLGTAMLLPKSPFMQPAAMSLKLPSWVGDWTAGPDRVVPEKVKAALEAADYRMLPYKHEPTGGVVDISVVLSNENLDQSIHRPERCLPAQGHRLLDAGQTVRIPVGFSDMSVPVRRLSTEMRAKDKDGKEQRLRSTTYYYFVGQRNITASHYDRTLTDIKDRFLRGVTQRWCYVMVSVGVTGREDVDQLFDTAVREFIGEFLRDTVNLKQIDPKDLR